MKNILFGLLATLALSMTSYGQSIGIVEKDKCKITCNTASIKKEWETVLTNQNTPAKLVSFEIIADKIPSSNETYYLLLAKNSDSSVKIARRLKIKGNKLSFYFFDKKALALSETITCSGCADGCTIKLNADGNWSCNACNKEGNCQKVETTLTY